MFGSLLAAVLAGVPSGAAAQTYSVELQPHTYQAMPIGGGTATTLTYEGYYYTPAYVVLTLPFTFDFYGQPYTQVTLMGNGTVSMGSKTFPSSTDTEATVDKHVIPSASAARHNFIAVWQEKVTCDILGNPGYAKTQIVSQPGEQQFYVIEWTGCRKYAASGSKFSAQLWLGEDGSIEVHYGTASGTDWSAGMGIENADGTDGTPGLGLNGTVCNPTCATAQFPAGHRLVYTSGPKVSIESVLVTPQPVDIGYPLQALTIVTNNRGQPLDDVSVRFWLGTSPSIAQAVEIGRMLVSIAGNASEMLPLTLDTSGLTPGTYYVIAEFDPDHEIFPADDPGPILASAPFQVKIPTAALRVLSGKVSAPGWVASSATFDVMWDMDNRDLLEAKGAAFSVVLSNDTTIDVNDRVIGNGYFSLAGNGQLSMTKTVALPDDLEDGTYYVGVWLDPAEEIPHVDRTGNKRMSVTPTTVGLELEITTSELPGGRVGEAYAANLKATGGDNAYTWTVVAGALPAGLSIVSSGGVNRLSGTPSKAGVTTFTLQASSAQFTETATYSVEILPALVPLEVSTGGNLPTATVGSVYSVLLEAHGGNPPYTWSIDSGTVPAGLTLSANGRFGGTPTEQGSFPIFVKVSDATSSVTSLFSLDVGVETLACIGVKNHAPVMVGEAIRPITLRSTGGMAPFVWTSVSGAVPGLELAANGEITGTTTTAGIYDWTLEVTDGLDSKARCHVALEVTELPQETEPKISTTSLPRGQVAESYVATLEVTDFTGNVTWSLGTGVLPEGLFLTANGTIEGVPSVSALAGEKTGSFRFEVVATDSAERQARATLDLELFDDRPAAKPVVITRTEKSGGCQSTSGDAGLLALGLALGVATLTRRNRR